MPFGDCAKRFSELGNRRMV